MSEVSNSQRFLGIQNWCFHCAYLLLIIEAVKAWINNIYIVFKEIITSWTWLTNTAMQTLSFKFRPVYIVYPIEDW